MTEPQILAALIVLVILMVFVRFIRRLVFILLRLAIFFAAVAVAVTGLAVLMNNETIYEKPGVEARIMRFLTMNSASTTEKGDGTATCNFELGQFPAPAPEAEEGAEGAPAEKAHRRGKAERKKTAEASPMPAAATPTATPTAAASGAAPEENFYPELMTRGYPGISRQQLFELSAAAVNSLGGWKIVKSDARSGTLDCLYTSRIFGFEDDVRITVTPKDEIEMCARSEAQRPDSTSWLKYFPGDFGANIAHIKQFYETIEPKMDEVYKKQQEKENAKKPR